MRQAGKTWALAVLTLHLVGMWGCGHIQYDYFPAPSWNPPILARPRIISREQVYVFPGVDNLRLARVGLFFFRAAPDLPEVGPAITRIFHQELLNRKPFAEVVLLETPFPGREEALRLAQRHRLDLLVMGEVPYFLDGGTVGVSGLQVDLKVVEVHSGNLRWCLSESIKAVPRPLIGLTMVETRPYPTPEIAALAGRLVTRLAATLEEGRPPPPPSGFKRWFSGD